MDKKKPSYLRGRSYIESELGKNRSDLGIESNNSERTNHLKSTPLIAMEVIK